ncbi:unknown [Prevotella sp. CAG:891]|nr:unknown [Prevotella sp. CAG:891]
MCYILSIRVNYELIACIIYMKLMVCLMCFLNIRPLLKNHLKKQCFGQIELALYG